MTRSQIWREIERFGWGLVPRGQDVVQSEPYFRFCAFRLNDGIKEKVGTHLPGLSKPDEYAPRPNTLKNADLPAGADPGQ